MNRSFVNYSDGTRKYVKNLGWLLRNWKKVESFRVCEPVEAASCEACDYHNDAFLVADIRRRQDGGSLRRQPSQYATPFASREVLWAFLNRPVFEGLEVNWFGKCRILNARPMHSPPC